MRFQEWLGTRKAHDNPRGDFIEDSRTLLDLGKFPDVDTLEQLLWWLQQRGACEEAVAEARGLWREYAREVDKRGV